MRLPISPHPLIESMRAAKVMDLSKIKNKEAPRQTNATVKVIWKRTLLIQ
jgi:hypothetical protein